jgi:hypothetical protein
MAGAQGLLGSENLLFCKHKCFTATLAVGCYAVLVFMLAILAAVAKGVAMVTACYPLSGPLQCMMASKLSLLLNTILWCSVNHTN